PFSDRVTSAALPFGAGALTSDRPVTYSSKRAMGFEPTTSSLGSWHSTTELRPRTDRSILAPLPRLASAWWRGEIAKSQRAQKEEKKVNSALSSPTLALFVTLRLYSLPPAANALRCASR